MKEYRLYDDDGGGGGAQYVAFRQNDNNEQQGNATGNLGGIGPEKRCYVEEVYCPFLDLKVRELEWAAFHVA